MAIVMSDRRRGGCSEGGRKFWFLALPSVNNLVTADMRQRFALRHGRWTSCRELVCYAEGDASTLVRYAYCDHLRCSDSTKEIPSNVRPGLVGRLRWPNLARGFANPLHAPTLVPTFSSSGIDVSASSSVPIAPQLNGRRLKPCKTSWVLLCRYRMRRIARRASIAPANR